MIQKLDELRLVVPRVKLYLVGLLNKLISGDVFFESSFETQRVFLVNLNSTIKIQILRLLECVPACEFAQNRFFLCLKFPKRTASGPRPRQQEYNFQYFRWSAKQQKFCLKFEQVGFYSVYLLSSAPPQGPSRHDFIRQQVFQCTGLYPVYNWTFVSNRMLEQIDFYCTNNARRDPFIRHLKNKVRHQTKSGCNRQTTTASFLTPNFFETSRIGTSKAAKSTVEPFARATASSTSCRPR